MKNFCNSSFSTNGRPSSGTVLNDTTIRWTMVWFNTRLMQAATISDLLDPSQTNPTNLSCTPYGTTSTNRCEILGGNTIFWEGIMGDGTDPTDRANNRLEISFEVTVPGSGSYKTVQEAFIAGTEPAREYSSQWSTITSLPWYQQRAFYIPKEGENMPGKKPEPSEPPVPGDVTPDPGPQENPAPESPEGTPPP